MINDSVISQSNKICVFSHDVQYVCKMEVSIKPCFADIYIYFIWNIFKFTNSSYKQMQSTFLSTSPAHISNKKQTNKTPKTLTDWHENMNSLATYQPFSYLSVFNIKWRKNCISIECRRGERLTCIRSSATLCATTRCVPPFYIFPNPVEQHTHIHTTWDKFNQPRFHLPTNAIQHTDKHKSDQVSPQWSKSIGTVVVVAYFANS